MLGSSRVIHGLTPTRLRTTLPALSPQRCVTTTASWASGLQTSPHPNPAKQAEHNLPEVVKRQSWTWAQQPDSDVPISLRELHVLEDVTKACLTPQPCDTKLSAK